MRTRAGRTAALAAGTAMLLAAPATAAEPEVPPFPGSWVLPIPPGEVADAPFGWAPLEPSGLVGELIEAALPGGVPTGWPIPGWGAQRPAGSAELPPVEEIRTDSAGSSAGLNEEAATERAPSPAASAGPEPAAPPEEKPTRRPAHPGGTQVPSSDPSGTVEPSAAPEPAVRSPDGPVEAVDRAAAPVARGYALEQPEAVLPVLSLGTGLACVGLGLAMIGIRLRRF